MEETTKKRFYWILRVLSVFGFLIGGYTIYTSVKAVEDMSNIQLSNFVMKNRILDRNNQVVGVFGNNIAGNLKFDEIPPMLINTIARIEDKSFWTNYGIDFSGVLRALIFLIPSLLQGKTPIGGSTITQQTMRLVFLKDHRISFLRKYRELIYSLISNFKLSKKQIIELYMNNAYFGHQIVGFRDASECLFGKELNKLNIEEYAVLVACLQWPIMWMHEERCLTRRNYVLLRMLEENLISKEQYEVAVQKPLKLRFSSNDDFYSIKQKSQAFIDKELQENSNKSLCIYTTIDSSIQKIIQSSLSKACIELEESEEWKGPVGIARDQEELLKWSKYYSNNYVPVRIIDYDGNYNGFNLKGNLGNEKQKYAKINRKIKPDDVVIISRKNRKLVNIPTITGQVTVMDISNGNVLGYTGTADPIIFQYLVETTEIASCMKPLDFLLAVNSGIDPNEIIDDSYGIVKGNMFKYVSEEEYYSKEKIKDSGEWVIHNWDNKFKGPQTLDYHLRWSRNIPFVNIIMNRIGLDELRKLLIDCKLITSDQIVYPGTIIGGVELNPINYAAAISTLANKGKLIYPILFKEVKKISGFTNKKESAVNNQENTIDSISILDQEAFFEPNTIEGSADKFDIQDIWTDPSVFYSRKSDLLSKISPQAYKLVFNSMKNTVFDGFCYRLIPLGLKNMYGKTGTSQENKCIGCVFVAGRVCIYVNIKRTKYESIGPGVYGASYPVECIKNIVGQLMASGSKFIYDDFIGRSMAEGHENR